MASDAHAHPFDLARLDGTAETERREFGVVCAASAWREKEFLFNEELSAAAARDGAPEVALCFGVHPQLPAAKEDMDGSAAAAESLAFLHRLVAEKRISAVGEAGFDLFDDGRGPAFREPEAAQEELFRSQLALARESGLPMVLHLRRAMHKAFAYRREFRGLPAVVFHSYSGTLAEAGDILKRGVNAYFSFGTVLLLNHKRAMEACALLSADRLLFETDAPYQPLRGRERSSWRDLREVIAAAARLRAGAGAPEADALALEEISDRNFRRAYGERV